MKSRQLKEKTLILRANADEASSSLAAAHILARLLGEIPSRIARIPSISGDLLGNLGNKLKSIAHRMEQERPTQYKIASGVFLLGTLSLFPVMGVLKWLNGSDYFEANWPVLAHIDAVLRVVLFQGLYMGTVWSLLAVAFLSVTLACVAMPAIALGLRRGEPVQS